MFRGSCKYFLIALVFVSFPSLTFLQDSPSKPRADEGKLSAIIISWDGTDPTPLGELLKKEELPNLQQLIKDGSYQKMLISKDHAPCTKPGHVEMLTGLPSKVTGVFSNKNFKPLKVGYSILERIESHIGDENIETGFLSGKGEHIGIDIEKGEPWALVSKEGALDLLKNNIGWNRATGPEVMSFLDKVNGKQFLLFINFKDPDEIAHGFGGGEKYRNAIKICDDWLGKIMAKLEEKGLNNTLIYVTTDHGRDEKTNYKGHNNWKQSSDIWLATNDKKVKRGGTLSDLAVTILKRYGVDIGKLDPKPVGTSLDEKSSVIEQESADKQQ